MARRRTYRRSLLLDEDELCRPAADEQTRRPVAGLRRPSRGTVVPVGTQSQAPTKVPPAYLGGDVLAGSLARAASQSTIHPIDTIKVRMQTGMQTGVAGVSKWATLSPPQVIAPGHAGPASFIDAGRRGVLSTVSRVGSLYKGCLGAAGGASLAMAFYFGFYGATTRLLQERTDVGPSGVAFLAGAAGAIGSSIVKIPAAVCIRSVQANVYPNVIAAAQQIIKAVGPRGLYTGYVPTLLEDVPDMAVKFACYETVRRLHRTVTGRNTAVYEDLAYGGVSGAIAAAVSTPLDVIKTRMMTAAASRPTVVSVFRQIMAESGHVGFIRGIGPRALSNGINSAIFFFFFEAIRGGQKRAWQARVESEASAAGVTGRLFHPSRRRLLFRKGTAVN